MKIRVNLMAHREERRKKKKLAFYLMTALSFLVGLFMVFIVWSIFEAYIGAQRARNDRIAEANKKLDVQIREIATLKQEIDALRSRQKAVEDLQADRNMPVYLFDELTRLTPEGIYLRSVKQEDRRVNVSGWAASNERVAEYLRNLQNNVLYVEHPELIEIRLATTSPPGITRRVFEFTLNFSMKANSDATTAAAGPAAPGAPAVKAAPVSTTAPGSPAAPNPAPKS